MQTILQNDIFAQIAFLEAEEEQLAELARKLLCSEEFNLRAAETKRVLAGTYATNLGVLIATLRVAKVSLELRPFDRGFRADPELVEERLDRFLRELLAPMARRAATSNQNSATEEERCASQGVFGPLCEAVIVVGDDVSSVDDKIEMSRNDYTALCHQHVEAALKLIATAPVSGRAVNVATAVVMEVLEPSRKPTSDDPDGARHECVRKAVQRSARARAKK